MSQALQDLIAALKKADWDKTPVHIAGSDFSPEEIGEVFAVLNNLVKPITWVTRRSGDGGRVLVGFETCNSDDYGAIPVYALDEVTK
jgi:hypothetical protein